MYRDQRLQTIADWPLSEDEDARLFAIGQLVALTRQSRTAEDLRTQTKLRLAELIRQLSPASRSRLEDWAGPAGVRDLLGSADGDDQVPAREMAPSAPETGVSILHDDAGRLARRPDLSQVSAEGLPASRRSAERLTVLTDRIESFRADEASVGKEFPWRSDIAGFVVEGFEAFEEARPFALISLPFEDPEFVEAAVQRGQMLSCLRVKCGRRVMHLDGRPRFDTAGTFRGYEGTLARRSRHDEFSREPARLAEVAHEILTPLNAIMGYAQMIEQEILGPAPERMKSEAAVLMSEARSLISAVRVLGEAASLDHDRTSPTSRELVALEPLFEHLEEQLSSSAERRGVALDITAEPDAAIWMPRDDLERVLTRLSVAALAFFNCGETFSLTGMNGQVRFARPPALATRSVSSLLEDPPVRSADAEAPLLGLAFTLKLARRLVERHGGELEIRNDAILVSCDASEDSMGALTS
ncbi:hypothetical protein B5C34_14045 [Pacificimonas flava]|uniref:histidine kinase n=2 Tax=Pacificimonas TaxID=1960290 RepID=A0A219B9I0_9SPHN|nr:MULTISPECIES: HAMP domain-containing sensor histidine kinase [Pacificimonas]MBZ6379946.1 HAMP domain-containing histidine kinase [Pacificimonas aurantium]OWV34469.1 hypothetical protein B5C34_14045 [Pacificimonas flava]